MKPDIRYLTSMGTRLGVRWQTRCTNRLNQAGPEPFSGASPFPGSLVL